MQARATSAQKLACSSRCTLTKAPFVRKGALDGSVHAAYTSSILTSTSYGKLRQSALLYQTQQYAPHPRTLSARSHVRAESRQTEERQPVINVPRFRLLPEVANVVPIDLDLDLSFEGNDYRKGMLNVQAIPAQPELALGTTQFCKEVDGYFTSSTESLDRYMLVCLCLKVCGLMTDRPHLCKYWALLILISKCVS